jgi:hypothetical protein
LLLLFELTRDIRIVVPLMAATGLSSLLVERWQGLTDPGLLGPDPVEEQRRAQLQQLLVLEALEPEAPLVLPADLAPLTALGMLLDAHGHCLLVEQAGWVKGIITLADLQQVLNSNRVISFLVDCLRSEMVWLPASADLSRLEDQLRPNGLRQVPIFIVEDGLSAQLPHGLPPEGLAVTQLRGIASRDGLSRALARKLKL